MRILSGKEFHRQLEEALESNQPVYTIKLVKEDDGTYDITIWDERLDCRCEDIEVGHIETYEKANKKLNEIVAENSQVIFLRLNDENIK